MQGPATCGVSADSPLGRSIATIGMFDALTSATTVSIIPASGVLSPVPNSASTITEHCAISEKWSSQACSSFTSTTVMPSRPRISRLVRASPRTSANAATTNTAASMPRCASVRATTKPSPPLLPRPQSTATRPPSRASYVASMAATTWRPAFSMSTSDGIPMSSMVKRSASRICAAFRMRIDEYGSGQSAVAVSCLVWQRWSTSTAASRTSATRSSRCSTTASCTVKASTKRCAPTTGGRFSTTGTCGGCATQPH